MLCCVVGDWEYSGMEEGNGDEKMIWGGGCCSEAGGRRERRRRRWTAVVFRLWCLDFILFMYF